MYKFINLEYLKTMSDGDTEMEKVLLSLLLEEPLVEIKKMIQLANEKNWSELKRVSHKMKSTLSFVGSQEMTALNIEIEQQCINETLTYELSIKTNNLFELYKQALPELKTAHNKI